MTPFRLFEYALAFDGGAFVFGVGTILLRLTYFFILGGFRASNQSGA